jgi:hypothetical protein
MGCFLPCKRKISETFVTCDTIFLASCVRIVVEFGAIAMDTGKLPFEPPPESVGHCEVHHNQLTAKPVRM